MNFTTEDINTYVGRFKVERSNKAISKNTFANSKSMLKTLIQSGEFQYFFIPDEFMARLTNRVTSQLNIISYLKNALKLIDVLTSEEIQKHFPNQSTSYSDINNVVKFYKQVSSEKNIAYHQQKRQKAVTPDTKQ